MILFFAVKNSSSLPFIVDVMANTVKHYTTIVIDRWIDRSTIINKINTYNFKHVYQMHFKN